MADITDPVVLDFTRQALRPFADRLVGLDLSIGAETIRYTSVVAPAITGNADGDLIRDGGTVEGDKEDLVALISMLAQIRTIFDAAGNREVLDRWRVNVFMP